ncbi:hypothetical protein [Roseovarius sp. SYSU LYC5161]|uniref:hypothetical protein n=1 Tax=Roseovarius halophilus (ex Wu et al. 2025) TaxID=3376060 RepID=UPI00399ABA8C
MRFTARTQPADLENLLRRILDRQLPQAFRNAATQTAKDVRTNTLKRIRKRFDRPVPYMERTSVFLISAKRGSPAIVGVKDHQASMYRFQEAGGRRSASKRKYSGRRGSVGGKRIPVPVKIDRDASGNMRFKAIPRILRKKDVFQAGRQENLKPGIYQREADGSGLDLLVRYRKSVHYKPVFDWRDMARKTIQARLKTHLRREVIREIENPVFRTKRGQKRF